MPHYRLSLCVALTLASTASAHYNMLLPEKAMAEKSEKVSFVYQFGHPFEHELFDAPKPTKVEVIFPDGKKTVDLTAKLEKFKKPGAEGKEVTAWRFDFTPEERGDHWFVLRTPSIWMEESKEFFQDAVKVVLHVQTQNGWDNSTPTWPISMNPLTRPYGLLPGMAFQGELRGQGGRIISKVEVERYNAQRPKVIPPDELVTFNYRTDPNGVFTCTLTEPGWWCMTARDTAQDVAVKERAPKKEVRDGKEYPVVHRATLWVHVEPKAAGK